MIKQRLTHICFANYFTLLFLLGLFMFPSVSEAQVQGKVFRDFNATGVFDSTATFKEIGLSGIIVTAYNAAGASVGTATTNSTGNYTIPSVSGAVRVEFTGMVTGDYAGPQGASSNTSVQFVTAPTTSVNFGVNYPADYCQANPQLAVSCYVGGTLSGPGGVEPAFIKFGNTGFDKYIGQSGYTMPTKITDHQHLGGVYGNAYSRTAKKIYTSAVLRRHVVFGPLGIGGIYEIDPVTNVVNNWLNIETLAGIDAGTDTRNSADPANAIPVDPGDKSYDYAAFALIGKQSLGDIDISDDGKTLYVINLFQQSLVAIDANTKTLVGSYPITASALGLSCPQSDFRPWGLKYYKGKLYIGVVCSAQTSQTAADLIAYVLEFDPNNTGAGYSILTSVALNYTREANPGPWKPWNQTSFDPGSSASDDSYNPQPMLSDIEFDVDGSLILGFLDRHMMMFSSGNGAPDPAASSTASTGPFPGGDILRICKTSTGFAKEGTTGCPYNITYSGGGEFYDDKRQGGQGNGNVKEDAGGSLAFLPGSGEIISTAIDEYNVEENGVCWWNNKTGVRNRAYMIFDKNVVGSQGKTSGLGDIELLCDAAPIEIGNRVWTDTNNNGIQDADEAGIDGVTVKLFEGTTEVASTTTANGGQYYFTNANVTGGVKTNTVYEIRIATAQTPLSTLSLATTDVGTNGSDLIDNDGTVSGANAIKTFTTGTAGQNNHSYDFGFKVGVACNAPTITAVAADTATCTNGVANVDAAVHVTGITDMGSYAYNTDGSALYAVNATASTASSIDLTSLANPSVPTTYTFRIWASDTTCYNDTTVILTPSVCPQCSITRTFTQDACNDNGTSGTTTDDYFTVTVSAVSATNGGASGKYEVVLNGTTVLNTGGTAYGTSVTVGGAGIFAADGSATYTLTVRDIDNPSCVSTVFTTTTTQNCSVVICPTPVCIPITVTRNN